MNDYLISLIRTSVPAAVGVALSWLIELGLKYGVEIDLPEDFGATFSGLLVVLCISIYYGVVRALESRWPFIGILLGKAKKLTYQ